MGFEKTEKLLNDILKYCFEKKITYTYSTTGSMNSIHHEKVDDKIVIYITIVNPKDKNINNMIDKGFRELQDFVNQISSE